MLNRRQTDAQWRTSQQLLLPQRQQKSPQKLNDYGCARGQENEFSARNNTSNSQMLKARPLISPRRTNVPTHSNPLSHRQMNERLCVNHPNKRAEFAAGEGEGEEFYCGRCAAQLATRGCEVVRIEAMGLRVSKRNDLPHYPQYQDEPIYQEIMEILRLCNSGIAEHSANIDRFSSLQQEYQQQMDLTAAFYDRLIEIIEEMKADHLFDLAQERDKYTQIADIENDHLRQNIIEINGIKNDIENHLQEVIEGIRESGNAEECRESLEHYRQKLTLFGHQLEEQMDSLRGGTRYPQQKIDAMLQDFEQFLKVLWDGHDQPPTSGQRAQSVPFQGITQGAAVVPPQQNQNMNSALTVKNIHQILPRGVNEQEGRRAFRNLQQEQDEPFQERRSPNFKKM